MSSRTRQDGTAKALTLFVPVWDTLAPRERVRVIRLLVQRVVYDGEQEAIVDEEVFSRVQRLLRRNQRSGGKYVRNQHGALLKGLAVCKHCGCGMVHHFATRGKTRYRYYVCLKAMKQGWDACPHPSLPAAELERFVVEQLREVGQDPAVLAECLAATREHLEAQVAAGQGGEEARRRLANMDELAGAVEAFEPLWEALSPSEQARLVHLLVERVEYDSAAESLSITFHRLGAEEEVACAAR